MEKAIERFLTAKRAENGSPCTVRAYRSDLFELMQFIGPHQGPRQLSRDIIRGFLAFLHGRGVAKTSIVRKLAAIRSFTKWLCEERILSDDVSDRIDALQGPRRPHTLPNVPSIEEMATLLDGDFPTAFPERDRLILELLYGDGLRVAEVVGINLEDLRPEQRAILIHGKGKKDRLVPFNPHSAAALAVYTKKRRGMVRRGKIKSRALLLSVSPKSYMEQRKGKALNVRSVGRMLNQMTNARGLQRMHPHLLRHACATHLLENRCPLEVISQLLGHANLDTTAQYAQVSTRLMLSAYKAAHPHAKAGVGVKKGTD
jgi:integrase/recombinase XerC